MGTTTKVAKELNRRFLGIDISEEYCKKAEERLRISDQKSVNLKSEIKSGNNSKTNKGSKIKDLILFDHEENDKS